MNYAALIFCPDEKTTRVLTQVLNDVEFTVEPCTEAFAAVKKLMAQRFDAVVVDCDNDQNAALMFKSVRNSEMNQAALTVAVVGDQAGVAKAFRLGANLVLTKPINVEQAKGTLRVARGLLKKGEAPKTTTSTPSVVAPSAPAAQKPAQPVTRAESAPAQTFAAKPAIHIPQPPPAPAKAVPAIAASALELEPEPLPAATPDDAALLESMPTPVNPLKNSWPAASETKISKPAFSDAHASSGAAAAPAREVAPVKAIEPEVKPAEHKAAATVFNLPKTEESAPEVSRTQDFATAKITHSDAPMFSSISGSADADASGDSSGKKIGIIAVAVVALATVGYFVLSKSHHQTAAPAQQSSQASPAASQSAASPVASLNSQPNAAMSTTSTKPAAQASSQISNTQPTKSASTTSPEKSIDKSADKTDKASEKSEKSSASAKNSEAVAEVAPLLVKNEAPQPPPAPVAETPAPEAPSMDVAASDASKNALSGIVSSVPASVPKPSGQAVKVSQGVSQGLLIKRVNPTYPPQAMSARIQGSVLLDAHIGKDGSITSVKALSGDAVLAGAAVDAVKQWKYKPYYLDGQAIDIETQITVNFKLP